MVAKQKEDDNLAMEMYMRQDDAKIKEMTMQASFNNWWLIIQTNQLLITLIQAKKYSTNCTIYFNS